MWAYITLEFVNNIKNKMKNKKESLSMMLLKREVPKSQAQQYSHITTCETQGIDNNYVFEGQRNKWRERERDLQFTESLLKSLQ